MLHKIKQQYQTHRTRHLCNSKGSFTSSAYRSLFIVCNLQRFHFNVSCQTFKVLFIIVIVICKTDQNNVLMFKMLTVCMYSITGNRSHTSGLYWVDLNHEIKENSLSLYMLILYICHEFTRLCSLQHLFMLSF